MLSSNDIAEIVRFPRIFGAFAGQVEHQFKLVSFDFATSQVPGWHSTIFPPYFVAGAIFGGFAMVLTLSIPARQWFGLRDLITARHVDNMAKILLAVGLMVTYAYVVELFSAWYSQNPREIRTLCTGFSSESPSDSDSIRNLPRSPATTM